MKLYGFGPRRSLRALWGLRSSMRISDLKPKGARRKRPELN
jgi:hypothetical protein